MVASCCTFVVPPTAVSFAAAASNGGVSEASLIAKKVDMVHALHVCICLRYSSLVGVE